MEPSYCRHCGNQLTPSLSSMGICVECVHESNQKQPKITNYPFPKAPKRLNKVEKWPKH